MRLTRLLYPCLVLLIAGLCLSEISAKSLQDIRVGRTHFGYRFNAGIDSTVNGTSYDAGYHGVFMGYTYRFKNNEKNTGRLTWDTSFNVAALSDDSGPLKGARFGFRTGLGYEYLIAEQMLLKLDLGVDMCRVSTESTLPSLVADEDSWEYGGHVDASLIYFVHPGVSVFGSVGMESLSDQSFQTIELDSGNSITFSTGIFFPW